MKGTIVTTQPDPTPTTFVVDGDLTIATSFDQPLRKMLSLSVKSGKKRGVLKFNGAEYDEVVANWTTDDALVAFLAKKFGLTA